MAGRARGISDILDAPKSKNRSGRVASVRNGSPEEFRTSWTLRNPGMVPIGSLRFATGARGISDIRRAPKFGMDPSGPVGSAIVGMDVEPQRRRIIQSWSHSQAGCGLKRLGA